jgi:hypothetical protein
MEELLKQAQDLVAKLRDKLSSVVKQSEELATARNQVEANKSEQQVKAAELAGREVEVRKVEDVQLLMKSAKALQIDNETEQEKLRGEWDRLTNESKKINAQRIDMANQQEIINKGNELLKKDRVKLKEDTENYKEKVIEELKTKI